MSLIKQGKVRDVHRVGYGMLQMIASDRCSAFDRHICDIPHKGYFLNMMSEWWFKKTSVIVPNHYLGTLGSSMFVKECKPLLLEVVVRGYITGSTKTSLWTHYTHAMGKEGDEFKGVEYCGHTFPAGLIKHQKLPKNVVTPTTKSETEDVPITGEQVVEMGLADTEVWEYIHDKALELFAFGQWQADQWGLILVDTKYEFGIDRQGNVLLIDELHTCDSSRYWIKEGYQPGVEPQKLDKDAIRDWVSGECDPYTVEEVPVVPDHVVQRVTTVYKEMYERFVGRQVTVPEYSSSVEKVALEFIDTWHHDMVVVIAGSKSDQPAMEKLSKCLGEQNLYHRVYFASAHKTPLLVLEVLDHYNQESNIVYIACAGMSNALSAFVAANTSHPTIGMPLFKDQTDMLVNIHSSLQTPSNVPSMTVLSAGNAAEAAARILNR